MAGAHQPGLLGVCRPVRRLHGSNDPARADRPSAARGRSAVVHRQLLRADRRRRIRSRRAAGQGQPLEPALVRGDDARRRRCRDAGDRRVRRTPPVLAASEAPYPGATPFEETLPYPKIAVPWVKQYDFRFVEGEPKVGGAAAPPDSYSKLWISDSVPRKIDALSLM